MCSHSSTESSIRSVEGKQESQGRGKEKMLRRRRRRGKVATHCRVAVVLASTGRFAEGVGHRVTDEGVIAEKSWRAVGNAFRRTPARDLRVET